MLKPFIFKANDIRGVTEGPEPEWDEAGAYALGSAFVEVFGLVGRSVVLGRDMRLSGPRMSAAFHADRRAPRRDRTTSTTCARSWRRSWRSPSACCQSSF